MGRRIRWLGVIMVLCLGPRGGAAGQYPAGQGQAAAVVALQSADRVTAVHQPARHDLRRGRHRPGQVGQDAGRDGHLGLSLSVRPPIPPRPAVRRHHGVRLRAVLRDVRHRGAVRLVPGPAPTTAADAEPTALPAAATADDRQRDAHRRAFAAECGRAGPDHAAARRTTRTGRSSCSSLRRATCWPWSRIRPSIPTRWPARRCRRSSSPISATPRRTTRASSRCGPSPTGRPFRPGPP